MNRTKEEITPMDALGMLAATLNNPSTKHERISMIDVLNATAAVLAGKPPGKIIAITNRGAVVQGLAEILAVVQAWKPAVFNVARGIPGKRVHRWTSYGDRQPPRRSQDRQSTDVKKIEHSISILDGVIKSRGRVTGS